MNLLIFLFLVAGGHFSHGKPGYASPAATDKIGIAGTCLRSCLGLAETGPRETRPSTAEPDDEKEASAQPIRGVEIVYSEKYLINLFGLERLHPFDIHKYRKIVDKLVKEGVLDRTRIHRPEEVSEEDILLVQSQKFLKSLGDRNAVVRYLEADVLSQLPISIIRSGILKPFRYSTGGTILAAELAIQKQTIAINVGGGYHHAKPDKGEGFCIYADIPIAIRKLQKAKKIKRALIVDVDAHQGNGTICCLEDDDTTFCFSIHQKDIYPVPKERGDLDVEIKAGTGDKKILEILDKRLPEIINQSKPDVVFVVGGCDPLEHDPLAGLKMSSDGIVKRDQMIVEHCVKRKLPVVFTLAGGYSRNAWTTQYASLKNLIKKYGHTAK